MKLIIAGSRDIIHYNELMDAMVAAYDLGILVMDTQPEEIVSGGARGPDLLGENYAAEWNIPVKRFIPDWGNLGKSAGMQRNVEMGKYADAAVILWDGKSKGAKHMIDVMRRLKKPCHVRNVEL